MADQKLDNLLNLALDSTEEERKKSGNLNIGYEERSGNWDIIVNIVVMQRHCQEKESGQCLFWVDMQW